MTKVMDRPAWVAQETFTYNDPSVGLVTINAGERIHKSHSVVVSHPEKFKWEAAGGRRGTTKPPRVARTETKLERELRIRRSCIATLNAEQARQDTRQRVEATIASQAKARAKAPAAAEWEPFVRLSQAEPSFTVTLSDKAFRTMSECTWSAQGEYETCGGLFGTPARSHGDTAAITKALEPGPATRSSKHMVIPDLEHIRAEAGRFARAGSDVTWVGSWHSHPNGKGEPSSSDLRFFAGDHRELNEVHGLYVPFYIALIVTPGKEARNGFYESSWVRPVVHAWRVRMVGEAGDQFVCSRAKLEINYR